MTFTADKEMFLKSVIISDSAISSKNSNTILSNCLFNINKNILEIIGTDNDITVKTSMDVISDGNMNFTVNTKKLVQITKELPKGEILIDIDSNYNIIIKSKMKESKGKFKLIGKEKGDFPDIHSMNEKDSIKIDQTILKDMLRKVSYAASTDVIKPSFNGVFLISEKKGFISVVASDSRRLSLCTRTIDDSVYIKDGIIIPLKTINELYKNINVGICSLYIKNNQCFFKFGETEIISRIIDGQFPNYKQVIPVDFIKKVFIKRDSFIESLRRVMVFTKEPSYKVLLTFLKDKVKIESKTSELGEGFEEIIVESNNDENISVGINSQYLLDSLKEIDFDTIELGITGTMSPLCIKSENDENSVSVIMPIQMKSNDNE
jgi:DNA polymerase III subunit beta